MFKREKMKKVSYVFLALFVAYTVVSCDELNIDSALTEGELIDGLKTALKVGTDSSASYLSAVDGYYGDALVKIPLPEEAENIRSTINTLVAEVPMIASIVDIDEEFENVVKSINKAAEESAKDAGPIFGNAITSLSIADGWDILNGINPAKIEKSAVNFDSTAATSYFQSVTTAELKELYSPKINLALDKDLLGAGFSANDAWSALRNAVNSIANNFQVKSACALAGIEINSIKNESIGDFATEKALEGLFFKVGEEEKQIRNNPYDWALDILHKVFGDKNE